MIREGTKESMQSEVRMPCMDVECMKNVLDFLYTGKVTWTKENVHKVALVGNYFGSKHLVDECSEMIGNYLNKQNCVSILRFADQYNMEKLREKGKTFVLNNFEDVCKSNLDFVKLSFDLLIELAGSPLAVICDSNPEENEKQLFKLLWDSIAWMEKEVQCDYLLKILNAVHLPCIGEQYLNYIETKVFFDPKAQDLIKKAKDISKGKIAGDCYWASLRGGSTISFKRIINTMNLQNEETNNFPDIFLQGNKIMGTLRRLGNAVRFIFCSDVTLKGKYHIKEVGEDSASEIYSDTLNVSSNIYTENDLEEDYITVNIVCNLDAWKSAVGDADVEVSMTISLEEK